MRNAWTRVEFTKHIKKILQIVCIAAILPQATRFEVEECYMKILSLSAQYWPTKTPNRNHYLKMRVKKFQNPRNRSYWRNSTTSLCNWSRRVLDTNIELLSAQYWPSNKPKQKTLCKYVFQKSQNSQNHLYAFLLLVIIKN